MIRKIQESININTLWLLNLKSTESILKNPRTLSSAKDVSVQTLLFDIQYTSDHIECVHQHHNVKGHGGAVLRVFISDIELVFNYRDYLGDVIKGYTILELQDIIPHLRMYVNDTEIYNTLIVF